MNKNESELFADWCRTGFDNLDREQLTKAAEQLKVDFAKQVNNETLRTKLREAIGWTDGKLPKEQVNRLRDEMPDNKTRLSLKATPPNLGPTGRWGGRYRRVKLVRTDFYKKFVAFPVSWEGNQKYFHFDVELDMAWPYYEAVKNMVEVTISQEIVDNGKRVEKTETSSPSMPMSDMGDVPGTEHLPISMVEYVARLAKDNNNFTKAERKDLIRIMRWLHGAGANITTKDLSDDEVRDQLLSFIGVDIYADA